MRLRAVPSVAAPARRAARERGGAERELIDLRMLCTAVLRDAQRLASERGVSLEDAQFASDIWGNTAALYNVLTTVLGLELRRAEPGTTLTLLTSPRRDATELRVITWRPADGAPSAPTAERSLAESRANAGALLYALVLVEAMGGSLVIEDGPGARILNLRLPHATE